MYVKGITRADEFHEGRLPGTYRIEQREPPSKGPILTRIMVASQTTGRIEKVDPLIWDLILLRGALKELP